MKISMDYSNGEDYTAVTWFHFEDENLVVDSVELIEPPKEES